MTIFTARPLRARLSILALAGLLSALAAPPVGAAVLRPVVGAASHLDPAVLPAFGHHASVTGEGGGDMIAVSCASAKFCVASDYFGAVLRFNGRSWSAPRLVGAGTSVTGVSCPTASFCLAVDAAGAALTFNGHQWSKPVVIDNVYLEPGEYAHLPLTSVSCATPHFCVATDAGSPLSRYGDFVMFDGTDLPAAVTLTGQQNLTSVSCASAAFCVAITDTDFYQVWRNDAWSGAHEFRTSYDWSSVSCATSSFCVASSFTGYATTFNGRSWSAPRLVNENTGEQTAVSCASRKACMVVDGVSASWWNGSRWAQSKQLEPLGAGGLDAVSCPTARFCAAVDAGNAQQYSAPGGTGSVANNTGTFASAATFNGKTWSRLDPVDRSAYVTAISCSSAAFCALISTGGLTATFNGKAWTRRPDLDAPPGHPALWLSCPATGFCIATNDLGEAYELKDGHWSGLVHVVNASYGLISGFPVSCATRDRCVAVGGQQAAIFNGSRWSRPRTVAGSPLLGFTAISCPSAQVCVAATSDGTSLTLHGQSWSKPATVSADGPILATISCASPSFCLTSDGRSASWLFNGKKWTDLTSQNTFGVDEYSCSAVGFCAGSIFQNVLDFYSGGRWVIQSSGLGSVVDYITAVSCSGKRFCAVADTGGNAFWG